MSVNPARRKRTAFYLSIAGLLFMVAAISTISARDPDGASIRVGMLLFTLGAAIWLPWQALAPTALLIWLGPNIGRSLVGDYQLFDLNMMLELPGLLGLTAVTRTALISLQNLESEHVLEDVSASASELDSTGQVFNEQLLRPAVEVDSTATQLQMDGTEAPETAPLEVTASTVHPIEAPTDPDPDGQFVVEEEASPDPVHLTVEEPITKAVKPAPAFDEEPPIEVYAFHAPEPAVDVYAHDWQTEAPLSVIRQPQPHLRLVSNETDDAPGKPVEDSINDVLEHMDETLELIRSLKKRSA